jgi:hypothetical protein
VRQERDDAVCRNAELPDYGLRIIGEQYYVMAFSKEPSRKVKCMKAPMHDNIDLETL